MKPIYEATWGWDKESKSKELFDPAAYFLILQTAAGELIAFSMFKFTWDDEEEPEFPVLYCYELHVATKFQGCGIGAKLMSIELEIAKRRGLWKTMLTCFKINTNAMRFYEKIGFGLDVNTPSAHGFTADYEILSDKPTRRC
jgi:N-alpha-acetyltransferase 40